MLARNETIFKWALYAAATALCFFVQFVLLQRFTLLGVIPFIYPVAVAAASTYEPPASATIFSLAVGVVCDLMLPEVIPCFYTLVFPLVGLCASLISQSWLSAGFLCTLATGALAFSFTGAFHCFLLWSRGKTAWAAGTALTGREMLVSVVLLTIPVTLLYRAVHRRAHRND